MTTQAEARGRDRAEPVYFAEITLSGSTPPTLYFSDRNIIISGQRYEDYLEGLSALGDEIKRVDSSGLNSHLTIRFRNEAYQSYGKLIDIGTEYPFDGASCRIGEAYLNEEGVPSDSAILFKGVLDQPFDIDLMGFQCPVSNMAYAADKKW